MRVADLEPTSGTPQAASGDASNAGAAWLSRVRAVALLAGSVRANHLRRVGERLVLELPVHAGRSLLDSWQGHWRGFAQRQSLDNLDVRVMIDQGAPTPMPHSWDAPLSLRIERDPQGFRGTGGLLRDLSRPYDEDDLLLVADASMLVPGDLTGPLEALASAQADVAILTSPIGEPAGLMLLRCGALKRVASVGFVDLKEQALPKIAESHRVEAVVWPERVGFSVRTLEEYVHAVRLHHCVLQDEPVDAGPYAEDWWPKFGIVEAGADVDPSAVLHDSVVLAGGRVEAKAVVVRSLIGPRGVVRSGEEAIELLVNG